MSKASKFRDMTINELELTLTDLKKELFNLKNEARATKKVEKPHLLKEKKKEKARLLTIKHEKQSKQQ